MKHIPRYLQEVSHQKKGRLQEKKAALSINSGSVWFSKGDLTVKESDEIYHVDIKTVVKQKSFKLSLKDIDKIWNDAGVKTPVIMIYINDYIVKCIVQKNPKGTINIGLNAQNESRLNSNVNIKE